MPSPNTPLIRRATSGLSVFSMALGTAQSVAPDAMLRLVGARPTPLTRTTMRMIGLRELSAGAGILAGAPTVFTWARAAGDAMDLGLLGNIVRAGGVRRRAGLALAGVAAVTAVDVLTALRRGGSTSAQQRKGNRMEATSAITVNKPPQAVYAAWRDLERLPSFMYHLESVTALDARRSRWVAKAPAGMTVEWDAEIVDDVPGELISWRSLEGTSVTNHGAVRFRPAPGGRGTELHVQLEYSPPGGGVGSAVAKLFGEEPNQQLSDDLRRFKQLTETGEIARSDASPEGPRSGGALLQPSAEAPDDEDVVNTVPQEVKP